MLRPARSFAFLTTLVSLGFPAGADPRAPVTVDRAPEDRGPMFPTGVRTVEELPRPMLEEEWFVSGEVDVFTYGSPPEMGEIFLRDDVETAYTTRILIRRPRHFWHFNGTVVVEWLNSTAGFDAAPAWDMSAEYFARSGIVWVGVTVAPVSIRFMREGCSFVLGEGCGERYSQLFMPEPGQAYEMVSQIVTLLRSRGFENPLPHRFRVRRVFHVGQSQQASDVSTYAREFHFEKNDGYFLQAQAIAGKPLSSGSPSFAGTDPRGWSRTDLPVPVVRAQTETDFSLFPVLRQVGEDTPTFRYYEMAGVAHNVVHEVELFELDGEPVLLEDLCAAPSNTGADGPIFGSYLYNAMWRNLERNARSGAPLPHGEPFVVEGGALARDEFGNVLGGIRLPAMDVPLASYGPVNMPKPNCGPGAPDPPDCLPPEIPAIIRLACLLSGRVDPFEQETLDALYPRRADYRWRVFFRSAELRGEGFLLPADQREILERALEVDVGVPPPPGCHHGKCGPPGPRRGHRDDDD